MANAHRDALVVFILIAAMMLLIFNGNRFLSALNLPGQEAAMRIARSALALNVALILFGWRRYVDLQHETEARADSEARAATMATTDALTGLFNRKGFAEQAERLLRSISANDGQLTILSIQLDRFKSVNDRHGFDVGDELLRRISHDIIACLDPAAIVARVSGDEFAIALTVADASPADASAEQLLRRITRVHDVDGKVIRIGAFIGVAAQDDLPRSAACLLRRADIALDHARTARSTRPIRFDGGMERALLAHSEIEQALHVALEQQQLEPYFEPQIDLASGDIVGFEMLARWHHPTSGTIMPDQFIPIAEDIGVIGRLSEQVMRAAFISAARWDPAIKLSVNISPLQLGDAWLAQKILRLLSETGFPANRLIIEITESSLFADIDQARVIVTSLRNQGIALALDDFGSGFSSLSNLRSLPFDVIKIDRGFVASIGRDRDNAAIVKAVVALGQAIGVPVTVEGVEDADTHDIIARIGCAVGQGWYYGKPLNAAQTAQLLHERDALLGGRAPLRAVG